MARSKAFFFIVSLSWIFLVLASRGLVTLPDVEEVASSEDLAKTIQSQRKPAQLSLSNADEKPTETVNKMSSTTASWSIEPLTVEDYRNLKK